VENKEFSGDEFHHCLKNIYLKKEYSVTNTPFLIFFGGKECKTIITIAYNM
jgi:hypothetical protein